MSQLIIEDDYDLQDIIDFKLEKKTPIIFILDLKDKKFPQKLLKAVKDGFQHPIIEKNNLYLFQEFDENIIKNNPDWKKVLKLVKFSVANYISIDSKKNCDMYISIDPNTIKYLHNYTHKYKFKINNNSEQREISGVLAISPLSKQNFLISVVKNKTQMGDKEEVANIDTLASFHSHPAQAYLRYNVCAAYPSDDDYKTYLFVYLNGYGAFHIVSCLEGLYIITISDSLLKVAREDIFKNFSDYEKFIEKNYSEPYPECSLTNKDRRKIEKKDLKYKDIYKYINKVNKLPYFKIQFIPWTDTQKLIKINYKSDSGNCFVTDSQVEFNKLLTKINKIKNENIAIQV